VKAPRGDRLRLQDMLDAVAEIQTYFPVERPAFDAKPLLQSHIFRHLLDRPNILVARYVVVPICIPLFFGGFLAVVCAVSLVRRESVYPAGPPFGLSEPLATAALWALSLVVLAPYVAGVFWMGRNSKLLGYSRQFWRILVASTLGTAVLLALILLGIILAFSR
jgi:hypothetical protein